MSLSLNAELDDRDLRVELEIADGEHVAVIGPNGAGKSTILNVIAGLLRPDRGRAVLDDDVLFDLGGARSVWTAPHARGTAMLAQDALLFPHLKAVDNVAFGPRSAGQSRSEARETARHWLSEVDAVDLADRKPAALSGGQAQRVAVARALAIRPHLLLLDEPMVALDVTVAPALRQMLRRVLAGRSAVMVTHDLLDALFLADRVVVVDGGRIVEQGPSSQVLTQPRSEFGARIAGLNLVRGTFTDGMVRAADGLSVSGLNAEPVSEGESAVAVFDPAAVGVYLEPPGGSPRNVIKATITELEPRGAQVRVRTESLSADVTAAAVAELDLTPGSGVQLVVKASEVAIYPA